MLDKSLVNAYGEPAHTHSLLDICTAQAACRTSLAPQANLAALGCLRKPPLPRYGSSLRAKYRLRSSRGKDIRTTLPPICGTFHSRSAPPIMPKPTTCLFGQSGVNTLSIVPPTAPDVGVPLRCGCVRRAQSVGESVTPAVHGSLWTAYARTHTALYVTSGVGSKATLTPDVLHSESPMLNKLPCNAYGSPAHTLALQSLAALPTLHRTPTSPNHEIKP